MYVSVKVPDVGYVSVLRGISLPGTRTKLRHDDERTLSIIKNYSQKLYYKIVPQDVKVKRNPERLIYQL